MTDLISRADAIKAIELSMTAFVYDEMTIKEVLKAIADNTKEIAISRIKHLPSAEAVPTVIRAKTFMRKEDFDKWAEDIKKQNKSIVCIPCDAEVVLADAVHGEWVDWLGNGNEWECSICKCSIESHGSIAYNYCPMCGARMKGGAE